MELHLKSYRGKKGSMGSLIITIAVFGLMVTALSIAGELPETASEDSKLSYSIGYQVGGDFRRQEVEIDARVLVRGVEDALKERDPAMPLEEMRSALMELSSRVEAARLEKERLVAARNLAEGTEFLERNGGKDGITVRPSGLQYQVLKKGEGGYPAASDTVTVHYRGTLIDGTEFDSSYKRGEPATFRLDKVIKGWTEGLQLMQPGAKFRFFLPADLAYGERGAGGSIGPNTTLLFEVELLSVEVN